MQTHAKPPMRLAIDPASPAWSKRIAAHVDGLMRDAAIRGCSSCGVPTRTDSLILVIIDTEPERVAVPDINGTDYEVAVNPRRYAVECARCSPDLVAS